MRDWLVEKGIAPERIYTEENSFNSYENIKNAYEIIEKEGLSRHAAIATDGYHQTRCQIYADRFGDGSGALSAYTNPGLLLSYWMRDLLGVAKIYVLGN